MELSVKIGERTQKAIAAAGQPTPGETSNELGLELEKVPPAMAEKLGIKEGQGLRVKDLEADGAGGKLGLRPGDVILEVDGQAVSDASAFNKAVSDAKKNKLIRLKVHRGSATIFLAGPLG
jgi:S1-C subfamily serine protease